jgi:predicted DNA-binding transcriptional regulator YafY
VRRKLEETFGQFELRQTPEPEADQPEEQLVRTLREAIERRRVAEIEYLKEGEEAAYRRLVEPYQFERELPFWRVHTWDRTVDAPRTYRLDRMRAARMTRTTFKPRESFEPAYLSTVRTARVWYSPEIARWKVERGARPLADGSAVSELAVGSADWLASEVLADRGQAVVIAPGELRRHVARRAHALGRELRLVR